jgi:hypothetical protein
VLPDALAPRRKARPRPRPQLRLAAVNTAQSACLTAAFGASFFHTYDVYRCDVLQCGLAAKVRLRGLAGGRAPRRTLEAERHTAPSSAPPLPLQQLLSVFRTQHAHSLALEVRAIDSTATVSLQCDNGAPGCPGATAALHFCTPDREGGQHLRMWSSLRGRPPHTPHTPGRSEQVLRHADLGHGVCLY